MHGFFPGPFFLFGPALLFFGLLRLAFFVLLIVLVVRLFSHDHWHGAHTDGSGHGYGHRHSHGYDAENLDPRRAAAWRYAAGKIDRGEFDRIVAGLDAAATGVPATPPSTPTPQA